MDPKIIGPGIWTTIHLLSIKDPELFRSYLKFIQENFPCIICRNHINEYFKNNPIENIKTGEEFKWSWMFHNEVNIRLGKSYMGWSTAYKIYHEI
jgi:hypothetical protein